MLILWKVLYLIPNKMKKETIYITEGISELIRFENTIMVIKSDWTKKSFPIEIIESIYIMTNLKISTNLLELLNQFDITIYFHWYYWNYVWSFFPKESVTSGAIIVDQVINFEKNKLLLSKKLMDAAFYNMIKVLERYKDIVNDEQFNKLKILRKSIYEPYINGIDTLMWLEWNFRQIYYDLLWSCIKNKNFTFDWRNRQPPRDPINSLISLLNMSCYNTVNDSIIKSQLSPFISFYHSMNQRRYNLSLDLAEIFKPILVDRLILNLINNNVLKKTDFKKDKSIWMVSLTDDALKIVFIEWRKLLDETILVEKLWKKYNWKYVMILESYKLLKFLSTNEDFDFYKLYK